MYKDKIWEEYVNLESRNYSISDGKKVFHKKSYLHFDSKIYFPKELERIKKIVSDPQRVKSTKFDPFLKINTKTPRYRYEEEINDYALSTKIRPICFASHRDALIYGFYSFALGKKYEEYIKDKEHRDSILAYRAINGKCNIQFAGEAFDEIRNKQNCVVLALDVSGFFDNIDHQVLKEKWCKVIGKKELPIDQYKIYRSVTKFSYVYQNSLLKNIGVDIKKLDKRPSSLLKLIPGKSGKEKFDYLRKHSLINDNYSSEKKRQFGIPQGSPISSLLSNIYFLDFDEKLFRIGKEMNFSFRRYCDDILIICEKGDYKEIQRLIISEIEKLHLSVQDKKTEIVSFEKTKTGKTRGLNLKKMIKSPGLEEEKYFKSIQYLGFEFNGQKIYLRSSSLSRYYRKMKSGVWNTVAMAYGKNEKGSHIFRKKLYERYTHLGKRNFYQYALNAASKEYKNSSNEIKKGLNSPSIKKQLSNHFAVLVRTLDKKNEARARMKKMPLKN